MNLENIIKRPVTKDYILSNSIYMNAQLNILKSIELYILPVCDSLDPHGLLRRSTTFMRNLYQRKHCQLGVKGDRVRMK